MGFSRRRHINASHAVPFAVETRIETGQSRCWIAAKRLCGFPFSRATLMAGSA
jgi:hypothetical protein